MANGQCFNQACPCNEAFSQELVLGSLGFSRCCGTDSNIRLPWQFSDFRSNSKALGYLQGSSAEGTSSGRLVTAPHVDQVHSCHSTSSKIPPFQPHQSSSFWPLLVLRPPPLAPWFVPHLFFPPPFHG